jgi:hypothetical protein
MLLSMGTVADTLFHCRVHLLGGDQYDGLKRYGPHGVDRQGDGGGGHTIRQVNNDEKIIAPRRHNKKAAPIPSQPAHCPPRARHPFL